MCLATAAGCAAPNFAPWPGWPPEEWLPRPVDGSAIQIIVVWNGLFEHELGHLLGLDDYGYECAWEDQKVFSLGVPSTRPRKVQSLYSYRDGPRSWQALVDDPSKYHSGYFNCRSNIVTDRDKADLSAIYNPRAFEGSRYSMFEIEDTDESFWQFQIAIPPSDYSPSKPTPSTTDVCDPQQVAGKERRYVYNAYAWVIMHRAKGSTGAWKALREDTAGTTSLDDGNLISFTPSSFLLRVRSYDANRGPTDLLEMIDPEANSTPVNRPDDCNYLAVNVDLTEAAYANIRSHEFVVVGLTRGDPLVNTRKQDGTATSKTLFRSRVLLDLGNGAKYWTLGQPSAVMTYPNSP